MKKNNLGNLFAVDAVVKTLEQLAGERETWERDIYARSNAELYRLLAGCLGVYTDTYVNATETAKKDIRDNISKQLKAMGVKVQRNTQTMNLFVKFVFGSDRKRADKYAYVLRVAAAEDQTKDTFADWVKDAGGIEEVKRNFVLSAETRQKREDLVDAVQVVGEKLQEARMDALGTVTFDQPTELGDVNLLIAEKAPDGTVRIVGVLPDVTESLLKRVQHDMGKLEVESIKKGKALGTTKQALPAAAQKLRPRVSTDQAFPVPTATLSQPKLQVNAGNSQA